MAWMTTTDRLRARLRFLVKHGDAVKIAAVSARRRRGKGLTVQNLSYFLNGHRKRPLSFDDLEDIAFYFNQTIGDLFDAAPVADAAPAAEQRLLVAWGRLEPDVQAHLIEVVEAAADAP